MISPSGNETSIASLQAHTLRNRGTHALSLLLGAGILALLVALAGDVSAQTAPKGQTHGASAAPAAPDCGTDWTRVASPNVYVLDNQLFGIAVISSDDIWAVGWDFPPEGEAATLTEHWDGNSWTVVDSPNPNPAAVLTAVSAISSNSVWAVGYYVTGGSNDHTLTEHWNGTSWNIISSPDIGEISEFEGVATVGPGDVWAVGRYYLFGLNIPLAEHWDGNSWSVVATIKPGTGFNEFKAVTAVSTNDVWAVGDFDNGSGSRSLAEHWNGNQWSVVNISGIRDYRLNGVSALAANDIWAVGTNRNGTTLTEHWDGTQWVEWPSANPSANDNTLVGVTMVSANNVWAVGEAANSNNQYYLLIEHFNGNTWNTFDVVSEGSTHDLFGVGAVAADDVWAVGDFQSLSTNRYRTLIERRHLCPTSTPTRTATRTPTRAPTRTPRPTNTPGGATATPCAMTFTDVPPGDVFYTYIRYLYCEGVISGYSDNTFRPGNPTTRGQLCKIVVLAVGWPVDCPTQPHFTDVPTSHPFYCYIETTYAQGVISGYSDGTFQPGNNVTRGQLSKIVVSAMSWSVDCPAQPDFSDVPTSHPFYCYIETAFEHGIISGYSDGTFRPGNNATRGQICKIVYLAVTQIVKMRK